MTKFDRDFEEWLLKNYYKGVNTVVKWFYGLPIEMQFGVYILFGHHVGYDLLDDYDNNVYIKQNSMHTPNINFQQAMQEAVKQFKEWYNENNR